MGDLFFLLKTIVLTIVLVALMQIRFGGQTLETMIERWAKSSAPVEALREVSAGAVKALNQGYRFVARAIDEQWNKGSGTSKGGSAGSRADHESVAGESL